MKTIGRCTIAFYYCASRFWFFIFNEFNYLPGKLVEDRLQGHDVNNCKLHPTDVCTCHGNVIQGGDAPDSFDHQRNLLTVFLDNPPIQLVLLLFHFAFGSFHKRAIGLKGIVKG